MADDEDDIILTELNNEELVEQMHDDLYDGMKEEIEEGVNILLDRDWEPYRVLTEALVEGMTIVGIDFRDGILSSRSPACRQRDEGRHGDPQTAADRNRRAAPRIVIGTVKGDIHDIGKNLVGMMMEGAGFEVIDLGINNPVEEYLEALDEHSRTFLACQPC